MFFGIHQHITRCIPNFITEVSITFHTPHIKVDITRRRRHGCKGKTQSVCTIGINTVSKLRACALFNFRRQLWLHHARGAFGHQTLKINTVNQVDRVKHVTLRFRHFIAALIANKTGNVNIFKRNFTRELLGHHNHASDPEENDVESCH